MGLGAVDATTFILPDGAYRQFFGSRVTPDVQAAASSKDGLVWSEEGSSGLPVGVSGRVVRLSDGRYRIYYGVNYLKAYTSVDGKTWQEEPASSLRDPDPLGDPNGRPQNTYGAGDIAIMPDGSYRMFYEHSEPSPRFRLTSIASATSADGLVWQKDLSWNTDYFYPTGAKPSGPEAVAAGPGPAHPSVITLPDGTYKLFYWNDTDIWSATSRDGHTWTNRKLENIFGADPDGLVLPDGRIVLFVNWQTNSVPNTNPAGQLMWMYVWQRVPFAFAPPAASTQMSRQNSSRTLSITGTPGKDIRFTATVYSGMKGVFAIDDPASPMKVRLTPAQDGTAVRLDITDIKVTWVEGLRGGIIVVADDGTTRVSAAVPFFISQQ